MERSPAPSKRKQPEENNLIMLEIELAPSRLFDPRDFWRSSNERSAVEPSARELWDDRTHGNIRWHGVELLTPAAARSHVELKKNSSLHCCGWVERLRVRAKTVSFCLLFVFRDGTNSSERNVGTSSREKNKTKTDTSCPTLAGSGA